MTVSITMLCHYDECRILFIVDMLNVVMQNVIYAECRGAKILFALTLFIVKTQNTLLTQAFSHSEL